MLHERFKANLVQRLNERERGVKAKLAKHLDVTPALVTQLQNGDTTPTLRRVEQCAAFFGVSPLTMLKKNTKQGLQR